MGKRISAGSTKTPGSGAPPPSPPSPRAEGGGPRPLDGAVRERESVSWGKARSLIETGKVYVDGVPVTDPLFRVTPRMTIEVKMNAPKPRPGRLDRTRIVFLDNHVVVVEKPPGISTVPFDESETDTLDVRVREAIQAGQPKGDRGARPPLGIVHRIDKETSGLVVFTRSWLAKDALTSQFRGHSVERSYVALVHGALRGDVTFDSHLVADRGDGLRGSIEHQKKRHHTIHGGGQRAITHVSALEPLQGATLLRCRLETGRTHQIRVHLAEAGHALVGDRVYTRDLDKAGAALLPAPRLMLHAEVLGFEHPKTGEHLRFESAPPADFVEILGLLRG